MQTKKYLIIGCTVVLSLLGSFIAYKCLTYDGRPAVVQAAEVELKGLVPQRQKVQAQLDALNAQIQPNEDVLKTYHYAFDEQTLKAVPSDVPFK